MDKSRIRSWAMVTALFGVAFLVRCIALVQLQKSPVGSLIVLDAADYDQWAVRIARGDWIGKNVFYAMPFYPYFLGVIYFLFGHALSAVRVVQILIGALNCALLFGLAKKTFGNVVAVVSGIAYAFLGWAILYDMMIVSTSLIVLSYLCILNLAADHCRNPSKRRIFLIGIATGISSLIAANAMVFTAVFAVWIFMSTAKKSVRRALAFTALFLAGCALMIAPVTVRNYSVAKDFVPVTAHGGLNFYLGNNTLADGANVNLPFLSSGSSEMISDSVAYAQREAGRALKPSQISAFWFGKGCDFIRSHPGRFVELLGIKLRLFFLGYEMADIFSLRFYASPVPLLGIVDIPPIRLDLIIPLAVIGIMIAMTARRKDPALATLLIFLGSYIFSVILFLVNTRYKLPIIPVMILFAAYAVVEIGKKIKEHRSGAALAYVAGFLLLYPLLNSARLYEKYRPNPAGTCVALGCSLLEAGDSVGAIREFTKAVELEPRRAEAHNMLGVGFLNAQDAARAQREFQKAIELKPGLTAPYNNLAQLYIAKKNYQEALRCLEKSLALNPNQPQVQEVAAKLKK
ncbi:MAG: tetratricopeptide repeat protein [Candidatus Omnitrophota bacterium]